MTPSINQSVRRSGWALASLVVLAGGVVAAPPAPAPRLAPGYRIPAPHQAPSAVVIPVADVQELVVFASTRPLRARLTISTHGQPLATMWRDKLKTAFDYFDRDKDGVLNAAEVTHIYSDSGMVILLANGFYQPTPQDRPSLARLDTSGNGSVSFDEFIAYYRKATAELLRPQATAAENPYNSIITQEIFTLLDANTDGKLTKEEVGAAEKWLASRDTDEDECLSQAELINNPYGGGFPRRVIPAPQQGRSAPPASLNQQIVQTFEPGQIPDTLTQHLIKTYDTNGDGKLTRTESGFDNATFTRLDQNSDGQLDSAELQAWRTGPPDLEVTLALAAKAGDCVARVQGQPSELAARGFAVKQVENGRVIIRVGRQAIELWSYANVLANTQRLKQQYQSLFTQPAGTKGYVVEKDLTGPNAVQFQFLRTIFDAADANSDGRLTRDEFDAYFDLQESFRDVALAITPSVQTPTLFQLLDETRDGRLSVRELRTAWDRLIALEPGGAEVVTRAAIQPTVSLRLSRSVDRYYVYQVADYQAQNPTQVLVPQKGPLWFRKMDRNADGDVSRNEFLGTRAEFDAIDTDHDGLISLAEAETWDRKVRRQDDKAPANDRR